jgi:hypothetical protein
MARGENTRNIIKREPESTAGNLIPFVRDVFENMVTNYAKETVTASHVWHACHAVS